MLLVELIIRTSGATLLLVIAALVLRDARDVPAARFGAILGVALAGVLIVDTSSGYMPPLWLNAMLLPLSMSSAIFIWWFSLSLFQDDFRLGRLEWSAAALWTAFGLINYPEFSAHRPITHEWAAWARSVMAIAFVGHIAYVALTGRRDDLVDARRRVRAFFALSISFLFLTDLFSEAIFGYRSIPIEFAIIQHSAFVALIIASFFWLARIEKPVLMFDKPAPRAPVANSLSPREQAIFAKLTVTMEQERAYLDPELSIGSLAERLKTPEHQLRSLINKSMGHRNFRAFLNQYRMRAVKADLQDPEKAGLPILTIAMDAGFASLASFNRAFKAETGKTPSEFRNSAHPDPISASQN